MRGHFVEIYLLSHAGPFFRDLLTLPDVKLRSFFPYTKRIGMPDDTISSATAM